MSDKPILFSGPMVRALIAGTKTQTRRTLNPSPVGHVWRYGWGQADGATWSDDAGQHRLRMWAGDRLYVREHWRTYDGYDDIAPRDMTPPISLLYEADPVVEMRIGAGRFRQGMHMPRWASRITLTITDVRVERLQDINAVDALAEGVSSTSHWRPKDVEGKPFEDKWWDDFTFWTEYPQIAYRELWEAINGAGSWEANPWVVAYTFTVQMGNIDAVQK